MTDHKSASREMRAVANKTVRTFGGITGRRLYLGAGTDQPSNDGFVIKVPYVYDDEKFYRSTEVQLSHILFQTDALAQQAFADKYALLITRAAQKGGVTLNSAEVGAMIHRMMDVLETYRVTSLWGRLYAGSFALMQEMFQRDNEDLQQRAHDSIVNMMALMAIGRDPGKGRLDRFKPYCTEALKKVQGRSFKATLLVTKWLFKHLVNEILRQHKGDPPQQNPSGLQNNAQQMLQEMQQALQDAAQQARDGQDGDDGDDAGQGQGAPSPSSSSGNSGDAGGPTQGDPGDTDGEDGDPSDYDGDDMRNTGVDNSLWNPPDEKADLPERAKALQDLFERMSTRDLDKGTWNNTDKSKYAKDYHERMAKEKADDAMSTDPRSEDTVEEFLDQARQEMEDVLRKAKRHLQKATKTDKDDWLTRDVRARVVFEDVGASQVQDVPLDVEDRRDVDRLRRIFHRVMGQVEFAREHTGEEIDVQAYVERLNNPCDNTPVFRSQVSGQGFSALLLVDLSGSMSGSKIQQTSRACEMLRKALDYPFVDLKVWGFTSVNDGEAVLVRFPQKQSTDLSAHVRGTTPLHIGVQVAIRDLQQSSKAKHLVVLTDGEPVFSSKNGRSWSRQVMYSIIHDEIKRARHRGVSTTGLLVGDKGWSQDGALHYAINPQTMRYLFGPSQFWSFVDPSRIGHDLISTVSKSFTNYLRSR